MSDEPSPPSRLRAELGWAVAMFVIALLWLEQRAPAIVQKDGSRDLAFARDMVEGTKLHGHGAWSGLVGLVQGTSWINFLALGERLGFDVAGIERVLSVLLAATVGGACLAFARLLPTSNAAADASFERTRARAAPVIGAALTLALLPFGVEVPLLWQPLLLPVPILLAHLCLWRVLRHGELVDALALAIFAALAFDVHIISAIVVWLALLVVPMASRRPLIATLGVIVLGLLTNWLSSPDVIPDHLIRLNGKGLVVPVLVALAVPLGLGALLRKRVAQLDWPARLRLALGVELMILAAVVLTTELDSTPEFGGRYLLPFLPALGLAAALATSWARSWLGLAIATLSTLALFVVGWPWLALDERNELPSNPSWRAADFDVVGARLDARAMSWTDAALQLQGPRVVELLSQLAARLDPGEFEPARPDTGLLLLAYEPAEAETILASIGDAPVEVIEFDGLKVLLIETSARLDRRNAEICRDSDQDCIRTIVTVTERVLQAHPNSWISSEDHMTADGWLRLGDREPPREYMWRLPIAPGPATVMGLPDILPEHCAWSFVAAEGFEPNEPLPTRELRLEPEAEGTIVVSRSVEGEGCDTYGLWPPIVIETNPKWTQLRTSLESDW